MKLRFFLLALIAFISSACVTTVRHSSDYQVGLMSNSDMLILPPVVEVSTVNIANKKERMYNYEYYLEDILRQEITLALQKRGFKAKIISRRNLYDQDLSRDEARLRNNYNMIRENLYKQSQWKEAKAFSINETVGNTAAIIGNRNNGNLLVMMDYARHVKSSSARTRDFMMDVFLGTRQSQDADKAIMVIAIIDVKTGNILWANMAMDMRDIFSSGIDNLSAEEKIAAKRINSLISTILKPLDEDKKTLNIAK